MMGDIRELLRPTVFTDDPEKTRIGGLLRATLLSFFVLAVLFVPIGILTPGSYPGVLVTMGCVALLVPAMLWLLKRGRVTLTSVLLVSLFFAAIVVSVATIGTVRAPIASLFLVCMVMAGLLLDRRGTIVVAVLSFLALFGLWSAETAGLLPPLRVAQFAPLLTFAGGLAAMSVFLIIVTRSVNVAFDRLRQSEQRLSNSLETLKQTQEQLLHAQKMEAVGRLAGGVAHDFNNLLTAILGHSDLLLGDLPPDSAMVSDLRKIRKAAEQATAVTSQLLAFSRKQVLQPKALDLNAVVVDMEQMLGRVLGEDIALELRLAPRLDHVMADSGQLQQVLMNLVVNARDAMPNRGRLTIATSNLGMTDACGHEHPDVRPGPSVMLAITDTGVGMDAETQAHLFDPFFTTKELGKGTGLGLSTVFGIVNQSQGCICVDSAPEQGTTFKVCLPCTDAPLDKPEETGATTGDQHGAETILLVEDDEAVRTLMLRFLQRRGHEVLVACDANEARRLSEKRVGPIHLLLTDVGLPGGMSGIDLAGHLTTSRPEMRVLCISGYARGAFGQNGPAALGLDFLQKPFTEQSLANKVRRALDAPLPDMGQSSP